MAAQELERSTAGNDAERTGFQLPEVIPMKQINPGRSSTGIDGNAVIAVTAAAAVAGDVLSKTVGIDQAGAVTSKKIRGLTRREFIAAAGLGLAGVGADTVLAACSPPPRPEKLPPEPPTPSFTLTDTLVASLKTTGVTDSQAWGREKFKPEIAALVAEYPSDTVRTMVMNVAEQSGGPGLIFGVNSLGRRLFYFGADSSGSGGAFVAVPDSAQASNVALPVSADLTRLEYRYTDSAGNFLDPRSGVLTGAGTGIPDAKFKRSQPAVPDSEVDKFVNKLTDPLSRLVKDSVISEQDVNAEFMLKVKYDQSGDQLFGVLEKVSGKGENSVYVVTPSGEVHQLGQVEDPMNPGRYLRAEVDAKTGEIGLYRNAELAGDVKKVDSTGAAEVELIGIPTPAPKPSATPTKVATVEVTLTPTPTATPKPTETAIPTVEPVAPLEVANARMIFADDFEGPIVVQKPNSQFPPHWFYRQDDEGNDGRNYGAHLSIIDDPTSIKHGRVLKAQITGNPFHEPDGYKWRAMLHWGGPGGAGNPELDETLMAPCGLSTDIWLSKNLVPGTPKPTFSVQNFFIKDKTVPKGFWTFGIGLTPGFTSDTLIPTIITSDNHRYQIVPNPLLTYENWFNLTTRFNPDRSVTVYINGQPCKYLPGVNNRFTIPQSSDPGYYETEVGLYAQPGETGTSNNPQMNPNQVLPNGSYLLYDNAKVLKW